MWVLSISSNAIVSLEEKAGKNNSLSLGKYNPQSPTHPFSVSEGCGQIMDVTDIVTSSSDFGSDDT